MSVKISIIIPVYNVEKYLRKCLDSLLKQDLPMDEYEIICVNDGSPDNSKSILEEYQQKYSNIVVLHQRNQGVSVARNSGLEVAKGDYVFFVDSDDWLHPNVLKSLWETLIKDDLDLLYPRVEYVDETDAKTGEFVMDSNAIEVLDGFHHQRRGFIVSLYKRSFLEQHNIRLIEGIPIAEDALFNIFVHAFAQRCSYTAVPIYNYLIRSDSAVNSKKPYTEEAFQGFLKMLTVLKEFVTAHQSRFTEQQQRYFDRPFFKVIEMIVNRSVLPNLSIRRYNQLREVIVENNLEYVVPKVRAQFKFFNSHWIIFLGYYSVKKLRNKVRRNNK